MQHRSFPVFWGNSFHLACACGWKSNRFPEYSKEAYVEHRVHVKEVKADDA